MTFDDFRIVRSAYLSDHIPNPLGNITAQNRLAVFRDPNYVILDVVYGMARFTVVLRTASILKSSPEGEGFSPNPRGGQ